MRILVTGGAGFIGSHLVDRLIKEGHKVAVVDDLSTGKLKNLNPAAKFYRMDIRDPELAEVFQEEKPEVVNHHAAQASVKVSVDDPFRDAQVNILGSLNLMQNSLRYRVGKLIFASTGGAIYGEGLDPHQEEEPPYPLSPYAVSKTSFEYYLRAFGQLAGLRYTILRYANVYGPRQDPFGEAGVVAIFSYRLLAGLSPQINGREEVGDPGCIRDYVFVSDVVEANLLSLTQGDGQTVNIGTGIGTTTQSLCEKLIRIIGYQGEKEYLPPRPGDLKASILSHHKAKEILGWEPHTDLDRGLRATVDSFHPSH